MTCNSTLNPLSANLLSGVAAIALACLLCPTEARAQPVDAPVSLEKVSQTEASQTEASQTEASQTSDTPPIASPRYRLNYDSSGNGYPAQGSVGGFFPIWQTSGGELSFIDAQLLIDGSANLSSSLVFGYRTFDLANQFWWGGYVAVDARNLNETNTYYQLGLGAELLANGWDAHINLYLPVGDTNRLNGAPRFQGNVLLLPVQAAMLGIDLGAGADLLRFDNGGGLRVGGDLYAYTADGVADAFGGRAELTLNPTPYLTTGLGIQSDSLFGTTVVFQVGVTLNPRSRPADTLSGSEMVLVRANEFVQRQSSIVLIEEQQAAINPATGSAYIFRHVDPGAGTATGNSAAVETPRDTVANTMGLANSGDIIYVQAGAAGGGFTIPDGVQVLSIGPAQIIDTAQIGSVQLPGSGVSTLPQLSDGVVMGNNTRLSGFAITAAPTSGIGVDARNANDVAIQNNQITNIQNFGIFYGADSGGTFNNVTIENNSISNVATYDGIFAGVSGGSTLNNLVIRNNQINTATRDGIGVGAGNNSQLNQATITKNQVTNTGRFGIGAGIDTPNISPPVITLLNSDGSTLSVAITNNTITNSGTNGSSPLPSGSVGIATQDANSRVCFELSG
ncbi:MAG: right-handed parallel beta-helix repeat-containing protein, partial [Cyanobacteria bacterium P01_H01_bin.119]